MRGSEAYCGECHQFELSVLCHRNSEEVEQWRLDDFHVYHRLQAQSGGGRRTFRCMDCGMDVVPRLPRMECAECGGRRLEAMGEGGEFKARLEGVDVDVDILKETLRMHGVYPLVRPLCWQLLLGYLPPEVDLREKSLHLRRQRYHVWSAQHFRTYNPISMVADEKSLLHQISVDVPRTHCRAYPWLFPNVRMQESLTRLLYVFSALFPHVSYFQGLNEVPIPFYVAYLMPSRGPQYFVEETLTALSDDQLRQVEADVFWSVAFVMDPVFRATEAETQKIHAVDQMRWEIEVMQQADPGLCTHLSQLGVDFMFFAFRWNVMFLIREFSNMEVLLYLFDAYILEGEDGFSFFHIYVACAFLMAFRDALLTINDTTDALLFLQALPTDGWTLREIKDVVGVALKLRHKYPSTGIQAAVNKRKASSKSSVIVL